MIKDGLKYIESRFEEENTEKCGVKISSLKISLHVFLIRDCGCV